MKKQILNAILINSNYQIKDVGKTLDNRKQNLIIFFMMSIISFILLIFMFPHFLSIIHLFLFIIWTTLTRALYKEVELIRKLDFIYEDYPQIISFIAQNISEFNKIDKNKITSYNWLDNQHYLNYLIQKKDLEGFRKFLPIFMDENTSPLIINYIISIMNEI